MVTGGIAFSVTKLHKLLCQTVQGKKRLSHDNCSVTPGTLDGNFEHQATQFWSILLCSYLIYMWEQAQQQPGCTTEQGITEHVSQVLQDEGQDKVLQLTLIVGCLHAAGELGVLFLRKLSLQSCLLYICT